jgi:hypothetical protein
MVRKIECPRCKLIMPYTKLHEHQRGAVCWRVLSVSKQYEFTDSMPKLNGKKKGGVKAATKRVQRAGAKIIKKEKAGS